MEEHIKGSQQGVKASTSTHRDLPRVNSLINDNQCITLLQERLLIGSPSVQRKTINFLKCKLSCCQSCSYWPRALTKEIVKSRVSRLSFDTREIKICQRCFLCHSTVLCKTCNKCPNCCHKSACRGQTSKLFENLAGSGCQSKSSSNLERGLHPPLSDPAKTHKVSYSHKLLCQSPQEQLPAGGITSAYRQKCSISKKQNLAELF